jgi:O-antigen ligase
MMIAATGPAATTPLGRLAALGLDQPPREEAPPHDPGPLGFAVFILLNAVLFVRPAEIVPALLGWPIYEILILVCAVLSAPAILERFRRTPLTSQPVTVCLLGLWLAVPLSQLAHAQFGLAYTAWFEYSKIVLYYLLLISLVTSIGRLRTFLFWLACFVVVLTALALMQYHGVIDLPALAQLEQHEVDEDTGEEFFIPRLRSTGIFNDPNDLSLILVAGLAITMYWLTDPKSRLLRFAWLLPLVGLGYGLALTKSRGGFLALLAGVMTLLITRFGWKKTVPLALLVLPPLVLLFGGRQTNMDLSNNQDTAQARIQLWREGLDLFKTSPVLGIGKGQYAEEVTQVAHNSYVHCYTELGVFGGTWFTGMLLFSVWSLLRARAGQLVFGDPDLPRVRLYLLLAILAYAVGLFSLSRPYAVSTYIMPGLATAFIGLPGVARSIPPFQVSARLSAVLGGLSLATLAFLFLFVRLMAK